MLVTVRERRIAMPMGVKRLVLSLGSLRVKTLTVLLGSALIAGATGAALILGIQRADYLIERSHLSQKQLELLMLLSGRVSDYSLAALEAARAPREGRPRLASAVSEVNAVFDRLDDVIERQVAMLSTPEEKNGEAVEGLAVARMRAMFQTLDRHVFQLLERPSQPDGAQMETRRLLDVFGFGVSPILAQLIEGERLEAQTTRRRMTVLRDGLTGAAAGLIAGALALALFLYLGPIRSILSRLRETISGASALAAGRLDTRLPLSGQDELTLLMASFNRMAANLARREADLVTAQNTLQKIVDERTAELRAANERLEAIDSNRRRFFADVSHELRTPLTVILGEAEVTLRRGDGLPPPCRKSMETIQGRARRLNRRVEDLLRLARSESGSIELTIARMEVGGALAQAVDDVAGLARKKGIDIALDSGPGTLYVRGDRDWLRQMFGGLIANALKYSPDAGTVQAAAALDDGAALIDISDCGCGIPADELSLVLDRFYRSRSGIAEAGHGVGLALARWIVEEHEGTIEIHSPGRLAGRRQGGGAPGTTVLVRLALADAGDNAPDQ